MPDLRPPDAVDLPIDPLLPEVVERLAEAGSLVLEAPPGAGKTTRVPPALVAAGLADDGTVVVLEPRRIAARAAARRIASEWGWRLGGEVGYQVRFERRAGGDTRVLVVTEGILLRMLQGDPFLEGVAALVFDEFHERSLDADLSLAMARRVQREVRPDLRLLVMSATLEAGPVAAYLGGCPVVAAEGRLHPVAVDHLPRPRPGAGGSSRGSPGGLLAGLEAAVAAAVERALAASPGDLLVFLPGMGEILRCREAIAGRPWGGELDVLPLHGSLPPEEQDRALAPAARRKVVLATNVAETSITIPGVTAVVDSGLVRVMRYDPGAGLDRLELARISRASATQRAGRAGREAPGVCLRLWTEAEHRGLAPRDQPEVERVDVAGAALQLMAWGEADPAAFPWLEPPRASALADALELLSRLGAKDDAGITARGRAMAALPLHPRLARLLLAAREAGSRTLRRAALTSALIAERDPFRRDRDAPTPAPGFSDLTPRLEALEALSTGRRVPSTPYGRLSFGAARHLLRAAEQIEGLARRRGARTGSGEEGSGEQGSGGEGRRAGAGGLEELTRALLAAFPDRLARRREPTSQRAVMVGGRGVEVGRDSAVRSAELFLCLDLAAGRRGPRSEPWVRLATGVEREWLPAERLRRRETTFFDPARGRVVARRHLLWDDLALEESEVPADDPEAVAAALVAAAAADLERALPLDEEPVAGFLARLRSLRHWRPELALPAFGPDELRELLPHLAAGRRSLDELSRAPLLDVLRGSLSWEQRQALEREAPERIEVPTGSRVRLSYEPGEPPVLAVRIQELYGLAETPRVAGGRVPVLLHLLAPNMRPQQVTDDLAGFWRRTYPEVRRELKGRYPKHPWPEDPLAAEPWRPGR